MEDEGSTKEPLAETERSRQDRYRQEIKWGQKKHRLTFVDQVEQKPIAMVFHVESYKQYTSYTEPDQGYCTLF